MQGQSTWTEAEHWDASIRDVFAIPALAGEIKIELMIKKSEFFYLQYAQYLSCIAIELVTVFPPPFFSLGARIRAQLCPSCQCGETFAHDPDVHARDFHPDRVRPHRLSM